MNGPRVYTPDLCIPQSLWRPRFLQVCIGVRRRFHQLDPRHRQAWASCVAEALATAEGDCVASLRSKVYCSTPPQPSAPEESAAETAKTCGSTRYEQIVPLGACPRSHQMLLVYVHPSHLRMVTLVNVTNTSLGSYCSRFLQQNYRSAWGVSPAFQQDQQKERAVETIRDSHQQKRMDSLFGFEASCCEQVHSSPHEDDFPSSGSASAADNKERHNHLREAHKVLEQLASLRSGPRRAKRRHRQRNVDCICCNRCCSHARAHTLIGETNTEWGEVSQRDSSCGCEIIKEKFGYGGIGARLLLGTTEIVFACVDLKLSETLLEHCSEQDSCEACFETTLEATTISLNSKGALGETRQSQSGESFPESVRIRRRIIMALQKQQLLAILRE